MEGFEAAPNRKVNGVLLFGGEGKYCFVDNERLAVYAAGLLHGTSPFTDSSGLEFQSNGLALGVGAGSYWKTAEHSAFGIEIGMMSLPVKVSSDAYDYDPNQNYHHSAENFGGFYMTLSGYFF